MYSHPEQCSKKSIGQILKKNGPIIDFIVVDEAHCTVQWGENFRVQYSKLASIRALCPNATMLALTGTVAKPSMLAIQQSLAMKVRTYQSIKQRQVFAVMH